MSRHFFLEFGECESFLSYRVAIIKYCWQNGLALTELFQEPTLDPRVAEEKSGWEINTADKPSVTDCLKIMSAENMYLASDIKDQYLYQPTLKFAVEGLASKSEEALMRLFMSYGRVVKFSKADDVAFVRFFRETEGLYEAVRHLNSLAIEGSKLTVKVVTEGRCTTICHRGGYRIEDRRSHFETKPKDSPGSKVRERMDSLRRIARTFRDTRKEMCEWKTTWNEVRSSFKKAHYTVPAEDDMEKKMPLEITNYVSSSDARSAKEKSCEADESNQKRNH